MDPHRVGLKTTAITSLLSEVVGFSRMHYARSEAFLEPKNMLPKKHCGVADGEIYPWEKPR